MVRCAFLRAPLWPAGHLPHEGGDQTSPAISPITNIEKMSGAPELPVSPQVGEMAGRPEGGAVEHRH
ncbi:lytic murein transglycosylase, partial [Mesorhizobium sp. M4A.F.Ca.ET.090.04.2.1]